MKLDYWHIDISDSELREREEFGNQFKTLRENCQLDITEAAEKIGVSPDLVERIESGCVSPYISGLNRKIQRLQSRKMIIAL